MHEQKEINLTPEYFRENAMEAFVSGFNCCQSVVLAFEDLLNIDRSSLLKLASSFGAGMGRLREVCGAVSGMFIIAGLLYGYDDQQENAAKAEHYKRIQHLAAQFSKQYHTLYCRDLLNLPPGPSDPTPAPRTPEYYKTRPCREIIGCGAYILAEYILSHPLNS